MSIYRKTCENCGDTTETNGWEPSECVFCASIPIADVKPLVEALALISDGVSMVPAVKIRRDIARDALSAFLQLHPTAKP